MAFIGMRHVVGAVITAETAGAEPTYGTSGSGFDIGKAITGNLTINRNTNPLYADDAIAEDDNGINSMDIELGLDDLLEDIQAKMGLLKETTAGSPSVTTYYETSEAAKNIGLGYERVRRKNGVTKFQAIWIYKVLFSRNNENSQTKGESIEWNTPTINGRCVGLNVDGSNALSFRKIRVFDTESDANTWLDGLANVNRSGG
jgi:phi13 family phage major tail protein